MNDEQREAYVRGMARARCERRHRAVYDSMICVGPESTGGFGPPCADCLKKTRLELEQKQKKAHGQEISSEEFERITSLRPREISRESDKDGEC